MEISHDIYLLWLYYYSTKNYQLSSIYFVILTFKSLKKKKKSIESMKKFKVIITYQFDRRK